MNNREISLKRAQELSDHVQPFLAAKDTIPLGTRESFKAHYQVNKQKLLTALGANQRDWDSWQWQLKNRITTIDQLASILELSDAQKTAIQEISGKYRWATTPYYLALIDPQNPDDPILKLSVPTI
ncbi:MAG: lysine 2,3-aminomutase, partial [Christensenellales bacterium]